MLTPLRNAEGLARQRKQLVAGRGRHLGISTARKLRRADRKLLATRVDARKRRLNRKLDRASGTSVSLVGPAFFATSEQQDLAVSVVCG